MIYVALVLNTLASLYFAAVAVGFLSRRHYLIGGLNAVSCVLFAGAAYFNFLTVLLP